MPDENAILNAEFRRRYRVGFVVELMRNNAHEVTVDLPMPFDDAVRHVATVLAGLGVPPESGGDDSAPGRRTIRVVTGGGYRHMNPVLVTVVLTNAMLFRGSRLRLLEALPREGLTLQVSLDSATPDLHDAHRGAGTWARAVDGIRTARSMGFTVRIAMTVARRDNVQEQQVKELAASMGIPPEHMVVRHIALQGEATSGIVLSRETLVPEVCATAEGVWWHPVGVTDPAMKVSSDLQYLTASIEAIQGFNIRRWSDRGLNYWAVSDLARDELAEFGDKFESATRGAPAG